MTIKQYNLTLRILYFIVAVLVLIWTFFPLLWIILASLKPGDAQFSSNWFRFKPSFRNYYNFFSDSEFAHSFLNSFIVTSMAVIISLTVGTPTAYALARFRLKNKSGILIFILLARMTPPVVLVLPFFLLAKYLGLSDTYLALIVMGAFLSVPFVIWMMRGFFIEIPLEIEESAIVDGCSRFTAIIRVVIPLAAPGFAATAVLCALLVWNEFLFALILSGPHTRTLPVLVNMFVSEKSVDWGTMSAAGLITVLPLIVFGLLAQKHLVRGLTLGSIK